MHVPTDFLSENDANIIKTYQSLDAGWDTEIEVDGNVRGKMEVGGSISR